MPSRHGSSAAAAGAGTLLAVIMPTAVVTAVGASRVARVKDTGRIQPGMSAPALPDSHLFTSGMITGVLAVAVIVVDQGAGVSEAVRTDQPVPPPANGDMFAQGARM